MDGTGNWSAPAGGGAATKEFIVPVTVSPQMTFRESRPCGRLDNINESAYMFFEIPDDFSSLTEAVVLVIPRANQASANWDIRSQYCAPGEGSNTHEESDSASTYNVTDLQSFEVDVSGILTSLNPGDSGGIKITQADAAHHLDVEGLRIKYS